MMSALADGTLLTAPAGTVHYLDEGCGQRKDVLSHTIYVNIPRLLSLSVLRSYEETHTQKSYSMHWMNVKVRFR